MKPATGLTENQSEASKQLLESIQKRLDETGRLTLTEKELCDLLGICRLTALRMRQKGYLPYCRVGQKILYLAQHVETFLTHCERRSNPRLMRAAKK